MRGRWFPWYPINLEVFFSDILATASRLNTFYGLETLSAQSSRHDRIIENVDIFDLFMTLSMLDFFNILLFLATKSVIK